MADEQRREGRPIRARRGLVQLAAWAAALPCVAGVEANILKEKATMDHPSAHDFDFLIGHWRVFHRRLRERLAGNDEWQEFDGTCSMHTILGGHGNIDDNLMNLPAGTYRGAGLRAFDASTGRWAIWWLDARHPHALDAPVVGAFERGVGTFYADDTFNGRPIRVRFRWTDAQTPSPRWEQAFSADAGKSWEVNWSMKFVRADGKA